MTAAEFRPLFERFMCGKFLGYRPLEWLFGLTFVPFFLATFFLLGWSLG